MRGAYLLSRSVGGGDRRVQAPTAGNGVIHGAHQVLSFEWGLHHAQVNPWENIYIG